MTLKSSDNLFRDLLKAENHVELKAKHDAAAYIRKYMINKNLAQSDLATLCGLTQPQVSKIVNFKLRDFSIDRLNAVLEKIDRRARIAVEPVFKVATSKIAAG